MLLDEDSILKTDQKRFGVTCKVVPSEEKSLL